MAHQQEVEDRGSLSRGCHHTRSTTPWSRSLGHTNSTVPRPHDGETLTALVVISSARIHTQRRWTGLPSFDIHHRDTNHTDTTQHENCSHHHPGIRRRRVLRQRKREQGGAGEDPQGPARHAKERSRRHGL